MMEAPAHAAAAARARRNELGDDRADHLPEVYLRFRDRSADVAAALDRLGAAVDGAGPLDERTQRLVKLGLAIGGAAEGAVRSNARKALAAGASPADVRHVTLLAITTCGFPTAIAGAAWVDEVLGAEA
jgi:alkylhydroperoxidase/carboxymuconolactone decarboxylase family protein YurZ